MNVWVKEIPEIFTINMVQKWVKKTINLQSFSSKVDIDCTDVLIISEQEEKCNLPLCNIVIYEEVLQKISYNILQEYNSNYNFYYLQNEFLRAKRENVETIITGSSYARFGILDGILQNSVNLSMISQDLYYSLKGVYKICDENKNINNIVLFASYYYFFSDISKAQGNEIKRLSKVYWPLFKDLHNCVLMPREENILFESDIFDIENIMQCYAIVESQKGYFKENKKRQMYASKTWRDKTKNWMDLSEEEMFEGGKNEQSCIIKT